ncbi:non-hydrolyzing UDP-N-acetylglucosamine 2-epimerase [Riemerella columbipharyngis]|uniref:UDP-GlcNAc3NAcA epimerase n=1 Tax=Riemerella columbipharyngis TaxID=1071918 RepID=A0A1G6YYI1_9FLAO|nr:UDP-N-acetylglucosamine 2-epimerase (non-hydrolyzing) [Riemerella columbipharyngis]SDD94695.1 UDP-GlcNAc3NAcA epimerase [Riemerella columbipharyngis]
MKILTILGARPQFIKAGSISREIAKHNTIKEIIVHTGQHYDANMSNIFFEEMKIPKPDYFLGIGGKSHGAMTGQMIEKIEEVALKENPDWIMVYGDTNSTLAGAIVASKLHIKLAHIEAGLRSFNMKMPEEINRILTDRVSQILFCPTKTAVDNLLKEGFENFECKIVNSGDVMQDGAMFYSTLMQKPPFDIEKDFILCTIHRAENTDSLSRLKNIFEALNEISKETQIVLPLHPRTKKIVEEKGVNISDNILIVEPLGYLQMVWLIGHCKLVMTDSGGLQKEAFFFKKPCITLRDETEWIELVEHKFNVLAGADKDKIISTYNDKDNLFAKDFDADLYGGGQASENIIKQLLEYK